MFKNYFFAALMVGILPFAITATENLTEKLEHADSIKSTDFAEFQRHLRAIELKSNQLTAEQKIYLKYLDGYEQVFLGNFEQSIHILQSITLEPVNTVLLLRAQSTLPKGSPQI